MPLVQHQIVYKANGGDIVSLGNGRFRWGARCQCNPDGASLPSALRAAAGTGWGADARPDDPAGAAQVVQPQERIIFHTCRQQFAFLRACGRFEALQLGERLLPRVRSLKLRFLRQVQLEQQAQEVLALDGLDLAPQVLIV